MTAPIFAQPTKDENLTPGWNVQNGLGEATAGQTGYAQPAVTGNVTSVGQAGAGYPLPAGAMNANPSENSASYSESILTNGSYTSSATTQLGQTVTWTGAAIPATTVAKAQPFGVNAVMTVAGGTVTAISYTPFGSTTVVEVEAGETTSVLIPAGASVAITYSVAPTSVTFVSTL
jgi:hypothetical protein